LGSGSFINNYTYYKMGAMKCCVRFFQASLSFIFLETCILGQQNFVSLGGDITSSENSISYSVGQVSYSNVESNEGTIIQGLQQPYEIIQLTGIETEQVNGLKLSVYPNPSVDYLKLVIGDNKPHDMSYQLYDNKGMLLQNKDITDTETFIEIGDYVSSIYYLQVCRDQKKLTIFKIIKN
jgi:hypothetical protein